MTIRGDADAEWQALTTDAGREVLAEAEAILAPGPAQLARWRRLVPPEVASAALRLVQARRRGLAKFRLAPRMWLDPVALEQATSERVARHKAARFAGGGEALVVDLCSGIGGDALALAEVIPVVAVDLDHGNARRLRWNAQVHGVADRLLAVRASAERFPIPVEGRVHIDPDRRAGPGPRAKSVLDYAPGLEFLRHLPETCRGGAIKLGPASEFAAHFGGPEFELEVISLDGECKEVTAWFGDLRRARRRATLLPEGATRTDEDGPAGGMAPLASPMTWVFDPDPALARVGLLDGLAREHGLSRLEGGLDLLTGPDRLDSPWLAAFKVREVGPVDRKRLRRLVADRNLGPLEIKVRGLPIRPESLRRELKPPGPNPASLLLVGGDGSPGLAILAERA